MITEQELIEKAKSVIMADCVDSIFASNQEIARYIKRKRKDFISAFESPNSGLRLIKVIDIACAQLADEGLVIRVGKSIKKPTQK